VVAFKLLAEDIYRKKLILILDEINLKIIMFRLLSAKLMNKALLTSLVFISYPKASLRKIVNV
jgi:hypothetical protein